MEKIVTPSVYELEPAGLTVDELVSTIRHLELRTKITKTICYAIEVGRVADALRTVAWETEKLEPQLSVKPAVAVNRNEISIAPMSDKLDLNRGASNSAIRRSH